MRLGIILLLVYPSLLFAGGFQVSFQGHKQAGMAHTGLAIPQDASTMYFNPGALSFTRYSQIQANGWFALPKIRFLEEGTNQASGMKDKLAVPFSVFASGNLKPTNKWKVGIGVYTPFGAFVEYPDNWPGRYVIQRIDLQTVFVQPTVSYNIKDKVGIGAGFIYSHGSLLLGRALPLTDSLGNTAKTELSGSASAYSFSVGLYYKVNKKFSIGASYRHQCVFKVSDGKADFTAPAALYDSLPDTRISTTLKLPWEASLGISYQPIEKVTLAFDVNYAGWKVFDTIAIDFEKNTGVLEDLYLPRNFRNTFTFRLGGQYSISEKTTIRAGTYLELNAVQDGFVPPEVPDADRFGISAGASFKMGHFDLDASLTYVEGVERVEKKSENYAALGGIYKGRGVIFGIGLGYNFYKKQQKSE